MGDLSRPVVKKTQHEPSYVSSAKKGEEAGEIAEEEVPQTVYRDKEGRRITKEEAAKPKTQWTTEMDWGGGLVQKKLAMRSAAQRGRRDDGEEAAALHEERLKDRERVDDPMAGYIKKRKKSKKSKELKISRPMYKGESFPNRYGILPGFRWDGRDYSNGFEQLFLKEMNRGADTRRRASKYTHRY